MESKYLSDRYLDKYLLFIYILINSCYIFKYIPHHQLISAIGYGLIVLLGYILYYKYINLRQFRYLNILLTGILLFTAFCLFFIFDPYATTASRWSALYYWSDKLFSGEYPYFAATHISSDSAASPFPVWQIVHIPFYFLEEIGISHLCVILILLIVLYKLRDHFNITLFLGLLSLAPAFWWEVTVRSDLMNNMFVCVSFITVFHYRFRHTTSFFLTGLSIGLLVCTRLFVIIPLAIYFIPWSIQKGKLSLFRIIGGTLCGFIIPFIPFMIWNWDMLFFSDKSPLILQTRQGNIFTALAGLLFIIFSSFLWKTYKQYLSYLTVILFIFIALSFSQFVFSRGFVNTIYNDIFDISYFGIAIPFILFGLSHYNNYEETNFRHK